MAYASWSVIVGEQPTAAKWNILGTNDASFNDGTGFGTRVIPSTAYADNSVASRSLNISSGIARLSADTGFVAATDLPGLVTSTVTPAINCTIRLTYNVVCGGSAADRTAAITILESTDNGGSYSDLAATYGLSSFGLVQALTYGQLNGCIERSLTAGTNYKWKLQGATTGGGTNAYTSLGTYLKWEILK